MLVGIIQHHQKLQQRSIDGTSSQWRLTFPHPIAVPAGIDVGDLPAALLLGAWGGLSQDGR